MRWRSCACARSRPAVFPAPVQKSDLFKAIGVGAALTVAAGVLQHDWVASHEALALSAVFAMGYVGIVLEEKVAFNKVGRFM